MVFAFFIKRIAMIWGEIAALTAAFLWAAGSFLFTSATKRIGSVQLNIDRMTFAAIFIAITMLFAGISFRISTTQFLYLAASGAIGLIIGDTALFRAFRDMGPRISLLIYSFNPAVAALLAFILFGEKLPWISILGILLTLSGIVMVVTEKPKQAHPQMFKVTLAGVIFASISAIGQAGGLIFAKYAFNESYIHSFTATFWRIFTSVAMFLPLGILLRRYDNPFKLYSKDKKSLKFISIASIIGPYLGITLSFFAISHTKLGIASTLLATVPVMILPMTRIVYKEKLSLISVSGAIIAFIGIALLFV